MVISLKDISNALSQISDLVGADKNVPGILFRVRDDIEVCYSGGNGKVMSKHISASFCDEDKHIDMAFNYQALTRIIDACKPTGKIVSDTIEFKFLNDTTAKIICEKKIPVIESNGIGEDTLEYQTMSVVEQLISWTDPSSSLRTRALSSEPYDVMYHYSETNLDEVIKRMYPSVSESDYDKVIKPISVTEWEETSDKWDVNELRAILSKLSVESGKLVYMAPNSRKAFVQTTSSVICIPVSSEFKHKLVLSSTMAKSISSILSKIESDYIYIHIINGDTVVYSLEDNSFAMSVKNMKQDNANVIQVNNCLNKDFSNYMINFNREVLQSCLYSAKTAGASDKVEIHFEASDGGVKLAIDVKNTNSSISNSYEVMSDYTLDAIGNLTDIKLNTVLEIMFQAVSRAETDYVAFDINIGEDNSKMVRVSEIDLEKRSSVAEKYGMQGSWGEEFTREHRVDILGYTTYFAVG